MTTRDNACVEIKRLEQIDERHEELRDDIKEIRVGFSELTKEIHTIGVDLRGFSQLCTNMLGQFNDANTSNRETFVRFGNKIDSLDERLRAAESNHGKIHMIEKCMYGLIAGIGALVVYYIQLRIK
jgi:hypothetical protein